LPESETTIAQVLRRQGYATAYIGKWHLDGPRRGGFTPPGPRRHGFDYWAAANCTHDYMHSHYYRDDPQPIWIEGYDADHYTGLAVRYIERHAARGPFCLFLSWGPPHDPYALMPPEYRVYRPEDIVLPPNCTLDTRDDLAGYYSHITALDRCFGRILGALAATGVADDTIVVFTSDHGDMLGSQGCHRKQRPWDESIRVPFALRYPGRVPSGLRTPVLLNVVDLMPTMLSLAGVAPPSSCEGLDLSHVACGSERGARPTSAFLQHCCTFADARDLPVWRGVRTERYTYAETRDGPWLLYDNDQDPHQLHNRVADADPVWRRQTRTLRDELHAWMDRVDDDFAPREDYWRRFGYTVDPYAQAPYTVDVGEPGGAASPTPNGPGSRW